MSPPETAVSKGASEIRRTRRSGHRAVKRRSRRKPSYTSNDVISYAHSIYMYSKKTKHTKKDLNEHPFGKLRGFSGKEHLHTLSLRSNRSYKQLQLHTRATATLQRPSHEHFGDIMALKPAGTFRIGFQNINMLPLSKWAIKSREAIRHIVEGQYDILMVSEVGLFFQK